MDRHGTVRIQVEAAKALADWKAFFAEQVARRATELARRSSPSELVTLIHYREAAITAAQSLLKELQGTESSDDRKKAA